MRRSVLAGCVIVVAACNSSGRGIAPIHLEPLVTLGAVSGDGAIATTPTVSALHRDGFRVVIPAHSAIGALPLIFSNNGEYRESLHGDTTQTGSFSGPMYTRFAAGDSIWVFDNSGRVLVFSPTRRYVRTVALPAPPTDAVVLGDGRILAVSPDATVELFDTVGDSVRRIGTAAPAAGTSVLLLPAANGTFWTSVISKGWNVQHWDTSGTRLGAIEIQPDWLATTNGQQGAAAQHADHPPSPKIRATWIDGNHLWAVVEVAGRSWRSGIGTTAGSGRETMVTDDDKFYNTIVEVRDLATGGVLATTRFDKRFLSIAGPGELVHVVHTSAGWQQAELLRVVWGASTSRP